MSTSEYVRRMVRKREQKRRQSAKEKVQSDLARRYGSGTPEYYVAYNQYLYGGEQWEFIKSSSNGSSEEGYYVSYESQQGPESTGDSGGTFTDAATGQKFSMKPQEVTSVQPQYSLKQSYLPRGDIDRRVIGREIYERSSPREQALLHTQTLFSAKGWEYSAGYVAPTFWPGSDTAQDVVYENIGEMSSIKTEGERRGYIVSSMAFNPPTNIAIALGTGFAGGAITSAVPRVGALASTKAGKAALFGVGAVYMGSQGAETYGYVAKGDMTKALGVGFQTTGELAGFAKGFKVGQRYGTIKLMERQGVGEAGKIALELQGTKSEWLRDPESVKITQLSDLPKSSRLKTFEVIRDEKGTVFGTTAKETQFRPDLRGTTADVDVGVKSPGSLQKKLLPVTEGKPSSGGISSKKGGHMIDIKTEKSLKDFPWSQRPTRSPGRTKMTRLDEETMRAAVGIMQRGDRAGWQGSKDLNRFIRGADSLVSAKKIQSQRPSLFSGRKASKAQALEQRLNAFKKDKPRITQRLQEAPEISAPTYLPRSSRITVLPKSSYIRPSSRTSRIPSSRFPGSIFPSSKLPSSRFPGSPYYSPLRTTMPSAPSSSPPTSSPPSKPPKPPQYPGPPSIAPPIKAPSMKPGVFNIEFFGKSKKPAKGKGTLKIKFGYSPSMTGIFLGSSIKKAPKISSGLGLRAPVRKK